jgi:hypothetical protein
LKEVRLDDTDSQDSGILLDISLPFGLVDTTHTLPLLLTVLGGILLAVMGIDTLLFDGRHVYSEPLGETDS